MIWKRYQNELIVILSLLVLIVGITYKHREISSGASSASKVKHTTAEFKELLTLKKRWLDKETSKKILKLQQAVPKSKIKWSKKGKKLAAKYTSLTSGELNKVITALLNLPVQIQLLEIKTDHDLYDLEIKCKW